MSKDEVRSWFRNHLVEDVLPRWLAAAPQSNGFFHTSLDRRWQPIEPAQATLVSQCRMLYCFYWGFHHTYDEAYAAAMAKGARFLLDHFRDPETGGWYFSVDEGGEPIDRRQFAYGYAFCALGLRYVADLMAEWEHYWTAIDIVRHAMDSLVDDEPGLDFSPYQPFGQSSEYRTQNPLMHLFEALLALIAFDPVPELLERAALIAELVHEKFGALGTGAVPELYGDDWWPLSADDGGRIDLGHAMEWAFLLSRGVELGLSGQWVDVAERLLDYGLEVGEDPDGGIHSNASPDGGLLPGDKGWWQQCELLRALIHFVQVRDRDDLWPKIEKHLGFVQDRFIDHEYGGWYFTPSIDGQPPENADKGSTWKAGYHVTAMCEEAMRVL